MREADRFASLVGVVDVREVLTRPVVLAPMGGGPSTPGLVAAGAAAGALGFLAAAYKSASELRAEIEMTRASTSAPFGVNLFVPGRPTSAPAELSAYLSKLRSEGYELADPAWNDDDWDAKIAVLLETAPSVVSFAFGLPPRSVVDALEARGVAVGVTVTSIDEATAAANQGAGFLCVQGHDAGAHRGTFDNPGRPDDRPLLALVRDVVGAVAIPVLAAGGIATRDDVEAVMAVGAAGVQCGTIFLRCPESGAKQTYKDALADARYTETVVTRAFSGRPARGLRNAFIDAHPDAPAAYPEINNATRPLRAVGDPDAMSLWAGTGWRHATNEPVADVLDRLS
ncbi:MAG: nitronate monooxygenase [Acidimicrobiaceae bacterium]|nr:nitronate monooxygenase [Acidimicrobiaceae bacterium]